MSTVTYARPPVEDMTKNGLTFFLGQGVAYVEYDAPIISQVSPIHGATEND